jgi:lysophospholipase L1-like esterase
MMKHILCYGDSNTHGLDPAWITGAPFGRHAPDVRWPGRLQILLGSEFRVIEEGLNGRTTVFEDPTCPGRNGLTYLGPCLESHAPLDVVILMLGTNDTKPIFGATTFDITGGMSRLVKTVLDPFTYLTQYPLPKVLVAAPVPLGGNPMDTEEMVEKSKQLAPAYRQLAETFGCDFIDLSLVAQAAPGEGVHLTAEAHAAIAVAFAEKLREMLR